MRNLASSAGLLATINHVKSFVVPLNSIITSSKLLIVRSQHIRILGFVPTIWLKGGFRSLIVPTVNLRPPKSSRIRYPYSLFWNALGITYLKWSASNSNPESLNQRCTPIQYLSPALRSLNSSPHVKLLNFSWGKSEIVCGYEIFVLRRFIFIFPPGQR